MAGQLRLGVWQSPARLDPAARMDWLAGALPQVAADGVDLLLLPELFASGYNIGDKARIRAEPADGPTAGAIAALARRHGVAIHYGYCERDGAQVFNAAQCFGPDGDRLGAHRKLILPPGYEKEQFAPGQGCTLFTFRSIRFATLICYDAEFAETARHVSAMGAQAILVPTALGDQWAWVARTMIPTRGYENGVYLAYANSAGVENGMRFLGQSFIAAPDGVELARAGAGPEMICADLDYARVTAAQARLPYLPDRTRLTLG